MRPVGGTAPLRAKQCMASEVFFRDVLKIHLSELDKGANLTNLDVNGHVCISGVLVIITSAGYKWRTDSCRDGEVWIFMV